jgi:hypothetical protein
MTLWLQWSCQDSTQANDDPTAITHVDRLAGFDPAEVSLH